MPMVVPYLVSKVSKAKATCITSSNSTKIYGTFRHDKSKKENFLGCFDIFSPCELSISFLLAV